jgi:hypothetical protein
LVSIASTPSGASISALGESGHRSGSKPLLKRQELKTFHHPSGDLHMILILESIKPALISLFSAAA